LALIPDGMSGEYNVFGIVLNSVGGGLCEGWEFEGIDLNGLDKEKAKNGYKKAFGLPENEQLADSYLFIFSHYS
jgi:hypothetical protein